ncbi:histone-lysine N-methyltransferase SETMAR [Elysia marginata]|uniref:Histone-lysine N-methyltransferase SETMAR n=1 Tax=Elysia marginata TaxID=1093978 RepID=A0AAV4F4I2_9GAST|nr:histone-lysine N-methyltransferase SETMAR [Elysia marginata]
MEAVEYRSVIKFLYLKGQNSTEIHQEMAQVYAEKCPNYSAVTHWVRKFKSGFLSVMDEHSEGRTPSVVTEKNASTVEKLIMQDRRITVKQLAFETKISIGSVETILHDHPNLNKVSARWVPRLLTTDQKQERVNSCKHLLRQEANDAFFFRRIVTMDETWIYQFDPEPKSSSMQWRRPSSPQQRKQRSHNQVERSCCRVSGTVMVT